MGPAHRPPRGRSARPAVVGPDRPGLGRARPGERAHLPGPGGRAAGRLPLPGPGAAGRPDPLVREGRRPRPPAGLAPGPRHQHRRPDGRARRLHRLGVRRGRRPGHSRRALDDRHDVPGDAAGDDRDRPVPRGGAQQRPARAQEDPVRVLVAAAPDDVRLDPADVRAPGPQRARLHRSPADPAGLAVRVRRGLRLGAVVAGADPGRALAEPTPSGSTGWRRWATTPLRSGCAAPT